MPRTKNNSLHPNKPRHRSKDRLLMYSFLAPALIIVFVVSIFPLLYSLLYSFQSYSLRAPDDRHWTGLANYFAMLDDPFIRSSIGNTVVFTFSSVASSLVIGLALALLVRGLGRGKAVLRTLFFLPMLVAPVVVGVLWKFLFDEGQGIINYMLSLVGITGIGWLTDPKLAMFSVVLVDSWHWTPYCFLVLLAGLESMPQEPFESAQIDGANQWQIFANLTLPFLMPLILISTVFRFTWTFKGFDTIFALTKGGPGDATEILALSVWRYAFSRLDIGMASALSVVMFLIMVLVSYFLLKQMTKKLGA